MDALPRFPLDEAALPPLHLPGVLSRVDPGFPAT